MKILTFVFLLILVFLNVAEAETYSALSEYLGNTASKATAGASTAKESFLTLIFGFVFVALLTVPFYLGLGKAMSVYGSDTKFGKGNVLKFLTFPLFSHLIFVIISIVFANIWDLFYADQPSIKLIKAFWETSAAAGGSNEWVKTANATIELAAMMCYYLIISAPLVIATCIIIISNVMLDGLKNSGENRGVDHLKNNVIMIAMAIFFSGILTMFYQKTIDKAMFQGQSITFKTYGQASSTTEMTTNFFKKIARLGITGQIVQ